MKFKSHCLGGKKIIKTNIIKTSYLVVETLLGKMFFV